MGGPGSGRYPKGSGGRGPKARPPIGERKYKQSKEAKEAQNKLIAEMQKHEAHKIVPGKPMKGYSKIKKVKSDYIAPSPPNPRRGYARGTKTKIK